MSKVETNLSKIAEQLVSLTVKEVSDLAKILKEEHGIEPASAPVAVAAPAAEEKKKEEKAAFQVIIKSFEASSKLPIIREVRKLTELGLGEAKALVESAPNAVITPTAVPKQEAEAIAKALKDAGAEVELR